jgi:hypothetical protein
MPTSRGHRRSADDYAIRLCVTVPYADYITTPGEGPMLDRHAGSWTRQPGDPRRPVDTAPAEPAAGGERPPAFRPTGQHDLAQPGAGVSVERWNRAGPTG